MWIREAEKKRFAFISKPLYAIMYLLGILYLSAKMYIIYTLFAKRSCAYYAHERFANKLHAFQAFVAANYKIRFHTMHNSQFLMFREYEVSGKIIGGCHPQFCRHFEHKEQV